MRLNLAGTSSRRRSDNKFHHNYVFLASRIPCKKASKVAWISFFDAYTVGNVLHAGIDENVVLNRSEIFNMFTDVATDQFHGYDIP